MTLEETECLLEILEAAYPSFKWTQKKSLSAAVWNFFLKEYSAGTVSRAVRDYIKDDIRGYPPSIGQLLAIINFNSKEKEHE
jgi:hypothetical protein